MEISLAAEKIGHIGILPVTNSMLMTWIAGLLLLSLSYFATRKMQAVPTGLQNALEMIVELLFNTAEGIIGSVQQTKKYFPLVGTIFLFVITSNWLGLIPGVGTIGIHETIEGHERLIPLLRSGNADLNMTLALALITVIAVQVFGIAAIGIIAYGKKFINFKSPIYFFVGILELMSEVTRIVSFSFRLFGNIFAGEVLLTVIAVIAPYIAPLPFFGLELFVGFVQALVFMMLALVFIKTAITVHDEAH
jgi:F-type H+-transporting ATPase subunit a